MQLKNNYAVIHYITIKNRKYDRDQKVILNIDRKITHGRVIGLLDLLKTNQFKNTVSWRSQHGYVQSPGPALPPGKKL